MSSTLEPVANSLGKAGPPAFPEYPQFMPAQSPGPLHLTSRTHDDQPTIEEVIPSRAWQGLIAPFASDEEARLALRMLAADEPISVHGGTLLPTPTAGKLKRHPMEHRIIGTGLIFDILVTEFETTPHPWVFSLSPPISQSQQKFHPHLRSDRSLQLRSKELHGLCIYSAAEFSFKPDRHPLPQFLDQVSIFLGKHVIWLKTLQLFNRGGKCIHDGIDMNTFMSTIPADAIWSISPAEPNFWRGFWPGRSAANGPGHLLLNPAGECWCGKGKPYKDCCLPWERVRYCTKAR